MRHEPLKFFPQHYFVGKSAVAMHTNWYGSPFGLRLNIFQASAGNGRGGNFYSLT
jgi:hypothetical protein